MPHQGPELPAPQSGAAPQMEDRKEIVVRDHVPLPGLSIQRKQPKPDGIPVQPVADRAAQREDGEILHLPLSRPLTEHDGEQRESAGLIFLAAPAREARHQEEPPLVFLAELIAGHERIRKIQFRSVNMPIQSVGQEWRERPLLMPLRVFIAEERAHRLHPFALLERQFELVQDRSQLDLVCPRGTRLAQDQAGCQQE